ncbi:MAG TPA: hypothetical protein PL124_09065 [Candidatus Cloacimonadota bacterium]|nr:hypothetical protein [Candidatus Cloacimonadota bacterium]HPS39547.1 hypothetical protein [Candidatus Cloacimonadota bacterium]
MGYSKEIKETARKLYTIEGKLMTEISNMLNISQETLYRWMRKGEWQKDIQSGGQVSLWLNMQSEFMDAVRVAVQEKKLTDPSTADSLWKTAKLMDRLMPEKVLLSNIYRFMEDMTKFIASVVDDQGFLETFQTILPQLGEHLREKYSREQG